MGPPDRGVHDRGYQTSLVPNAEPSRRHQPRLDGATMTQDRAPRPHKAPNLGLPQPPLVHDRRGSARRPHIQTLVAVSSGICCGSSESVWGASTPGQLWCLVSVGDGGIRAVPLPSASKRESQGPDRSSRSRTRWLGPFRGHRDRCFVWWSPVWWSPCACHDD
jgi:hypothetical protein